jgi:tRNA G18 (ribose-2'-O)-methylase SpoU
MIKSSNQLNKIVVIAHNIRSCHNVGSLFRTCEGLAINHLYLTGYTPYPKMVNDSRLPHISLKIDNQIAKTALGTQNSLAWTVNQDIHKVISDLKSLDYKIIGLEQSEDSVQINLYKSHNKLAIILGNEVSGIEANILDLCDIKLEIPMLGNKESFNVIQAAAMALFYLRFSI